MRYPQHFVMCYGIITGAHFFPYAWLYRAPAYGLAAGLISGGCLALGLTLAPAQLYLIPGFITVSLVGLAGLLLLGHRHNLPAYAATARH